MLLIPAIDLRRGKCVRLAQGRKESATAYDRDPIVVGIDSREGQVMTRGWEKQGQIDAVELARRIARLGIERIVYTDVARDGMLTGPNIEQTCLIARASGLKVTASGGVSSLEDIE